MMGYFFSDLLINKIFGTFLKVFIWLIELIA